MAALNYAEQYAKALNEAYPYTLYFGRLWQSNPNEQKYKPVDAKTIKIPTLTTTGRTDGTRDTIGSFARNFDNQWETKTLSQHRTWNTLVHPQDISQTNQVASIMNITKTFNEEQKFPEMDAYTISKIYSDWTTAGESADTTALTAENILSVYDKMLENMAEGRVPKMGLVLYVTPATNTLIKNAQGIYRTLDVGKQNQLSRAITSLDEVEIVEVPSELMKTVYEFTSGWKAGGSAKQIHMCLINPLAVITPVSYEFAKLDPPSALSEGKYVYYEESHEDVFVLKNKVKAIQMAVQA